MKPAPLVDVRGLQYQYPDGTQALSGVDFQLYAGERVALLGSNGSGKTTFVLHLNGLLIPGEGSLSVCGLPVVKPNFTAIRAKIGMVFQTSDEQLFLPTVLEDVAFGPRNLGQSAEQATATAREALERVGMWNAASRAPYHLSAGEKRRVALAGVLAMQPEILVLDEPTTYLDPPGQRDLLHILRELPQAKMLVTHDVAFAEALCSRAVFFEKGKIVSQGPVRNLARQMNWEI